MRGCVFDSGYVRGCVRTRRVLIEFPFRAFGNTTAPLLNDQLACEELKARLEQVRPEIKEQWQDALSPESAEESASALPAQKMDAGSVQALTLRGLGPWNGERQSAKSFRGWWTG